MTDYHIHIGQFDNIYYDSHQIFDAIESTFSETGVNRIFYSSTSTCRFDVELLKIEEEIAYAQNWKSSVLNQEPYLWYIPKYAEEGISVFSALQSFDYAGIKLHPYGQKWDFQNPVHRKSLEDIFQWSSENKKLILIHTGGEQCCRPSFFEHFFQDYPKSHPILAHSAPFYETCQMLSKFPNLKCDTSFVPKEAVKSLKEKFGNRVLFGTDFPLTNFMENQLEGKNISLSNQYKKDALMQF